MSLAGRTVLVVDDEPILTMTFSVLLQRSGARVLTAGNGAEALQVLQNDSADVILCDKQMPVMDGITFLRKLRQRASTTPVVLFVNAIDKHTQGELDDLNVRAIVSKPLQPDHLRAVLSDVLEQWPPARTETIA